MGLAGNSSVVLPHGQRENYFTLLFLFKILICPVSDRLATGVSYYWTNLPSTSKYPAAYMGFFFILAEVECRFKSYKSSQSSSVEYKVSVCPSPVT